MIFLVVQRSVKVLTRFLANKDINGIDLVTLCNLAFQFNETKLLETALEFFAEKETFVKEDVKELNPALICPLLNVVKQSVKKRKIDEVVS